MSTMNQDRLDTLEQRLGALATAQAGQATQNREVSENMTILLGLATTQQEAMNEVKERIERLDMKITTLDTRVARVERGIAALEGQNTAMNAKLDAIIAALGKEKP